MTADATLTDLTKTSLLDLHRWVRRNGWTGYDPYDMDDWLLRLPRRWAELRLFGKRPSRLVMSLAERHPLAMRRLFVRRKIVPKGMALFARAYLTMHQTLGDDEYLALSRETADWLLDHPSPDCEGLGWGLPFLWLNAGTLIPTGTPCGTVSAVCGDALWQLHAATGEPRYADACRRICDGFLADHTLLRQAPDRLCFSYTPVDEWLVHNLNLLVAEFLARVGEADGRDDYLDLARQACNYTLAEQRPDGSIPYWGTAFDRTFRSDHYHSGFEIRALHGLWKTTGWTDVRDARDRYYEYYRSGFFGDDGAPWRDPNSADRIDIHGCAEALICNAELADVFDDAAARLADATRWSIEHMQERDGHFIHQIRRRDGGTRHRDTIPYIRWSQAWMMRALSAALAGLTTE